MRAFIAGPGNGPRQLLCVFMLAALALAFTSIGGERGWLRWDFLWKA